MFAALTPQSEDGIIALMALYRDDPRAAKIDLGVGVYRDAQGRTPVMRAVREAARQVWEAETTKTYTALAGDAAFLDAMTGLILGTEADRARVAAIATPGGTGAVRLALDLIRGAAPDATIWVSDPTWPNHLSILRYLRMRVESYRYVDAAHGTFDPEGMTGDLAAARAGDVVLLHGCCHNPTGADPDLAEWHAIGGILATRGLIPLIDLAYQGFGAGLEADAAPTRMLTNALPEALIAASCSKTFGIYRERTGVLLGLGAAAGRGTLQANLTALNRTNYSFPPDHGARLVTTVLGDASLRADWQAELEGVRTGMIALRRALAAALRQATNGARFDFVGGHSGMFSRLGLSGDQVRRLRQDHAIYMTGDARINIAGLNEASVPVLAKAVASVL